MFFLSQSEYRLVWNHKVKVMTGLVLKAIDICGLFMNFIQDLG